MGRRRVGVRRILAGLALVLGLALLPQTPLIGPAQAWNYTTCTADGGQEDTYFEWSDPDCWYHGHVPTEDDDEVIINDDGARVSYGAYSWLISLTNQTMAALGKTSINLHTLIIGNNIECDSGACDPDDASKGILHVTGNKAVMQMSGDVTVGRDGGTGLLYVEDGAYLFAENLYLGGYRDGGSLEGWGSGYVEISGPGAVMQIRGDVLSGVTGADGGGAVGFDGTGDFVVSNGGALVAGNFNHRLGHVTIDDGTVRIKGRLTVQPVPASGADNIFMVRNGSILSATEILSTAYAGPFSGSLAFNASTLYLTDLDGLSNTPATTLSGNLVYENGMTIAVDAALLDSQPDLVVQGRLIPSANGAPPVIRYKLIPAANGHVPQLNTQFTVMQTVAGANPIDAASGLTTLQADSGLAFVTATAETDGQTGYLTLTRNAVGFGDAAVTDNEAAIGAHLESLDESHALYQALLGVRSGTNLRDTYNGLTGEIHSVGTVALGAAALSAAGTVQDHVASTFALLAAPTAGGALGYAATPDDSGAIRAIDDMVLAGPTVWSQAYGAVNLLKDSAGTGTVNAASGGLILGGDVALDAQTRAGLALGYSKGTANHSVGSARVTFDALHALAYGGMQLDALALSGGVGVAVSALNSTRQTSIPALPGDLTAAYGALTGQAFLEAAYNIDAGAFSVEPFAGLALVSTLTQAHTETGNAAALSTAASLQTSLYTMLGLRVEQTIAYEFGAPAIVSAGLGWRHLVGDPTPDRSAQFLSGTPSLALSGPALETDTLLLEAGMTMDLGSARLLHIDYDGQIGAQSHNHSLTGTLSQSF